MVITKNVLLPLSLGALFFASSNALAQAPAEAANLDKPAASSEAKQQTIEAQQQQEQRLVPFAELPDSPGFVLGKPQAAATVSSDSLQQTGTSTRARLVAIEAQAGPPPDLQPPQPPLPITGSQASAQAPVGTAAAGAIPANGIAASQPAGVAIAPAKQHRVRTIVLRMGAVIGAGVAIGTVVALTEATPSKPPGAH